MGKNKTQKNKSSRQTQKSAYIVPAKKDQWQTLFTLFETVEKIAKEKKLCFVLNTTNMDFQNYWDDCPNKPWQGHPQSRRVVILWAGQPLSPISYLSWRCGLIEEGDLSYRFLFLPQSEPQDWRPWIVKQLGDWGHPLPEKEAKGISVGKLVAYPRNVSLKGLADYDPSFLTISPSGRMADVLNQLDECKRMYRGVIKNELDNRRKAFHETLEKALALSVYQEDEARRSEFKEFSADLHRIIEKQEFLVDRNLLPKVLLLGPSGTGKTLVARYLAWRTFPGPGGAFSWPFKRIPIPEYLHRESDFEYDIFGYCAGAFTGAHPDGRKGFLLERVGGVVFFDEIGDASRSIQAKLLAYMDDYMVTPRGWSGDSIPCPTMIIAATNQPIDEWATNSAINDHQKLFRNDLYRRFNVVIRIPSLEERKEEFDYILDVLLQLKAFNPGRKIKEIGAQALNAFKNFDYGNGNFRDLEVLLRNACRRAMRQGRDYLVEADMTKKGIFFST